MVSGVKPMVTYYGKLCDGKQINVKLLVQSEVQVEVQLVTSHRTHHGIQHFGMHLTIDYTITTFPRSRPI